MPPAVAVQEASWGERARGVLVSARDEEKMRVDVAGRGSASEGVHLWLAVEPRDTVQG